MSKDSFEYLNTGGKDNTKPCRVDHDYTQRHLEEQIHQLSIYVETDLVSSGLHPVIRMRKLKPQSLSGKKNPGIRSQVLQKAHAHLINSTARMNASDNKLLTTMTGMNHSLPRPTGEIGLVWPYLPSELPGLDNSARHSRG